MAHVVVTTTTFGLRVRALGSNPDAARVAGIRVGTTVVAAMAVRGAFAGVADAVEVLGLLEGFSPGYGFEAIAVALLGSLHPVGMAGAALLFGALDAGGAGLQAAAASVPSSIVQVTEGLAVIYALMLLGIIELVQRRRRTRHALAAATGARA